MHRLSRIALLSLILGIGTTRAADWPQWLGPTRDNVTSEIVPAWKGKLKELWRRPMGEGNSAPVIVGNRVFMHSKVPDKDQEEVIAFAATTGKDIWRETVERPAFTSLFGNGPRATPAVAKDRLYTHGITGIVACFDCATGKPIWQVDTKKMFNTPKLTFGTACSPLLHDGKVFINVGAPGASVVAFDAATGAVVWKSLDDPASYSSPILVVTKGEKKLIVFTGKGVAALDPSNGKPAWQFPLKDALFESSTTPIVVGANLLVSSITVGSVALQVEETDGKSAYKELWKNADLTSYFSTPVPVGTEHVYLVTGKNPLSFKHAEASLHCVEMKTGKKLWSKGNVGEYHAALMRTGDGKLLMLEEAGNLVLIDPNPTAYKELARTRVCGHVWAHPAIADGKLFVRDDKELICVELPR